MKSVVRTVVLYEGTRVRGETAVYETTRQFLHAAERISCRVPRVWLTYSAKGLVLYEDYRGSGDVHKL